MAIEKMMEPSDFDIEDTDAEEIEVEIVNPEAVSIETDDGGVIIDFEGGISEELLGPDHDANLPKAIADKVSERIGGLRDRFAPHEVPEFTAMPSNYELKLRETLEKPGMTRLAPDGEWRSTDAIDPMRTSSVRVVYPGYFTR